MKLDALMGTDYTQQGIMQNSTKYVKSVTTEQKDQKTLEAIRQETLNKGKKVDVTA